MSHFDQFIQLKALQFKFGTTGGDSSLLIDQMWADPDYRPEMEKQMKQVCFPISVQLFERFEKKLDLLSLSKRQFLEVALIEALRRVDEILDDVDAFEFIDGRQEESK